MIHYRHFIDVKVIACGVQELKTSKNLKKYSRWKYLQLTRISTQMGTFPHSTNYNLETDHNHRTVETFGEHFFAMLVQIDRHDICQIMYTTTVLGARILRKKKE